MHIPIDDGATTGKVYLYHFNMVNLKNTDGVGKVFLSDRGDEVAKKIKGMIVFAVMGMAFLGYQLYINSIDTKYAIRFSEVFRT